MEGPSDQGLRAGERDRTLLLGAGGRAGARTEKTISGSPPYHNTQKLVEVTWHAPAGVNWFNVAYPTRAGAPSESYALDCSDMLPKLKESYGTQTWVDVTGEVSTSSTAKCLAARRTYDSVRKKVNQLRLDLGKAKTEAGKAAIRTRLSTAVRQRAQAAAGVGQACSG